ncbi:MAG: sulfatase-like hydrolase/transferase, partial [Promethearchaeota archaeon]
MSKKPNIILFITHDQGQYLGCYNSFQTPNSLKTPNLDKLAKDGVRFTNYFCTAPECSPSRGGIQTSLYPHQNGLMGLLDRGWTLPANNKTLPMYLKENGYTTHLLGFQHE